MAKDSTCRSYFFTLFIDQLTIGISGLSALIGIRDDEAWDGTAEIDYNRRNFVVLEDGRDSRFIS